MPLPPQTRTTFYINPLGLENMVGLGIISGFIIHYMKNVDKFPTSWEKADHLSITLLLIHLTCHVLFLGTFLYQLGFLLFRYFNKKVMPPVYQRGLEGCIQFMFGLCYGGYLFYSWDEIMTNSICILNGYCPPGSTPTFFRRCVSLKLEVCPDDKSSCGDIFYTIPAMMQTLKSALGAVFVAILWEKMQSPVVQISFTKMV